MAKIFRSESHLLRANHEIREDVDRTIVFYRRIVRALSGIIFTHWSEINAAKSKCNAIESYFHVTKHRKHVKYPILDKMMGKMPSYLRRAAIEHAYGAVSSYLSNLDNWVDDGSKVDEENNPIRKIGSRPPKLGISNVNPSLYGGNMIEIFPGYKSVSIKLLRRNGKWEFTQPLKVHGKLKRISGDIHLSPSLLMKGQKVSLSCPVKVSTPKFITNKNIDKVCAIDVGINTSATISVVSSNGTVIARKFVHCGRHNDQRDQLMDVIANKQKQTGHPEKGFCVDLFRRISGISLDAARTMSKELVDFALKHGAKAFVFERLKNWRPKGRSKWERKRFHRFQHRMLFKKVSMKAEEFGMKVLEVSAAGTSRYAYDGSGKLVRNAKNMQCAVFFSGKKYNADLNASYNIAARGIQILHKLTKLETGKSSGTKTRMPWVLADVWTCSKRPKIPLTALGVSQDAPIKQNV